MHIIVQVKTQETMNNLSIISIEKELIFKLRTNKNKFYEDVIKKNYWEREKSRIWIEVKINLEYFQ